MLGYYTVFDRENKKIGFAESTCECKPMNPCGVACAAHICMLPIMNAFIYIQTAALTQLLSSLVHILGVMKIYYIYYRSQYNLSLCRTGGL